MFSGLFSFSYSIHQVPSHANIEEITAVKLLPNIPQEHGGEPLAILVLKNKNKYSLGLTLRLI